PGVQIARAELHGKSLGAARDDAALILSRDPALSQPRGEALRHLLYIFGKDEAARLFRPGSIIQPRRLCPWPGPPLPLAAGRARISATRPCAGPNRGGGRRTFPCPSTR